MAITATLQTVGDYGYSPTGFTTASISPGNNCHLVMLLVGQKHVGETSIGATVTSSGSGPTWSTTTESEGAQDYTGLGAVYVASIGANDPGSFTVTLDWSGSNRSNSGGFAIWKVTGHDTTTPLAGATVSVPTNVSNPRTLTLGATPATGDVVFAMTYTISNGTATAPTWSSSPRTWTVDGSGTDAGGNDSGYWPYTAAQSTGSTSTSVTINDLDGSGTATSFEFIAMTAVIVKVAAGGAEEKSGSEAGAGTDDATLQVQAQGDETGSGTDNATLQAQAQGDETATGTDDASRIIEARGDEQATGTDDATLEVRAQGDETGTGSDEGSVSSDTQQGDSDSGIGTDDATLEVQAQGDEDGTATDDATLEVQAQGDEQGEGTDDAAVTAYHESSETGQGTDDGSVLSVFLQEDQESGTGTDDATVEDIGTQVTQGDPILRPDRVKPRIEYQSRRDRRDDELELILLGVL